MENLNKVKIDKLKKEFKKISSSLKDERSKINFYVVLKYYKKHKKNIKKLQIKNTKCSIEEKKINNIEIQKNKKEINQILKTFREVDKIEKQLLSFKNKITSLVMSVDRKKNSYEYTILKNENNIIKYKLSLDKIYLSSLKKDLSKNKNKNSSIKKKIESSKKEKHPINIYRHELIKVKKEIANLNSKINKWNKENKEKIKKDLLKLEDATLTTKNDFDIESQNIRDLLLLIENIKTKLSFAGKEDINKNLSFDIKHLDVWYDSKQALYSINMDIPKRKVIAIIGPSGCGKSTFLRTLNRINDNIPSFRAKGKILLDGEYDIFKLKSIINRYDKIELSTLRTKVGMIFQQPNPFPMSIYKNVTYGPKVRGISNKSLLNKITEKALIDAGLWEEVKDNLKALGTSLSGGQQQRLCIARAIANEPEILLMDEPTSALDPTSAKKVEDLIIKLKENYTIIMVTHSMQQAQRISDLTAFFYQGRLIEYGKTVDLFNNPKKKETREYISGKFG